MERPKEHGTAFHSSGPEFGVGWEAYFDGSNSAIPCMPYRGETGSAPVSEQSSASVVGGETDLLSF